MTPRPAFAETLPTEAAGVPGEVLPELSTLLALHRAISDPYAARDLGFPRERVDETAALVDGWVYCKLVERIYSSAQRRGRHGLGQPDGSHSVEFPTDRVSGVDDVFPGEALDEFKVLFDDLPVPTEEQIGVMTAALQRVAGCPSHSPGVGCEAHSPGARLEAQQILSRVVPPAMLEIAA